MEALKRRPRLLFEVQALMEKDVLVLSPWDWSGDFYQRLDPAGRMRAKVYRTPGGAFDDWTWMVLRRNGSHLEWEENIKGSDKAQEAADACLLTKGAILL